MMNKKPEQKQLNEIRKNFDFFDKDNNGQINIDEFIELLKVIEPTSTKEQAIKGFGLIDTNGNEAIDFDEFINWWQSYWWQY